MKSVSVNELVCDKYYNGWTKLQFSGLVVIFIKNFRIESLLLNVNPYYYLFVQCVIVLYEIIVMVMVLLLSFVMTKPPFLQLQSETCLR